MTSSIPNAGFTRSRNRLDTEGYGGVPFEQTHPFIAGLIGGLVVVLAAFVGGMLQ